MSQLDINIFYLTPYINCLLIFSWYIMISKTVKYHMIPVAHLKIQIGACFLSLARSKLKICSANHRAGYWSTLPCDWPSTAWAYSEQETEKQPRAANMSSRTCVVFKQMESNPIISRLYGWIECFFGICCSWFQQSKQMIRSWLTLEQSLKWSATFWPVVDWPKCCISLQTSFQSKPISFYLNWMLF